MGEPRKIPWTEAQDRAILEILHRLEVELSRVNGGLSHLHQYLRVRPTGAAAISECMALVEPLANTIRLLSELHQALYNAIPEGPWIQK